MMDFLRTYQLDFMLILTGICGLILFFSITIKNLSVKSRLPFILLNFSATILIMSDRLAYIYRGDESSLGFWMVRITNFLTFFCTVGILFFYNLLLKRLIFENGKIENKPKRFAVSDVCCGIAALLVVVSQFTGLYYTFDAANQYQRSPLNWISYIMPLVVMISQISVIIQYRRAFGKRLLFMLLIFDILPIVSSVVQVFVYGLSLASISAAINVILLYFIVLDDMNRQAKKSEFIEIEHLKIQQARMQRILDQTATSLIDAVDAKEEFTQGHSLRVAKYAKQIAEYAGKNEKEQYEIYYAGLLHDIGKIAIPDEIINKQGKLTAEEYEIMKQHAVIGSQMLSGIKEMPYLSVGAHFHHEHYDGTGYPEGLKGEEIPELARILAVADTYDAMSSMKGYRGTIIPQQLIREELIKYSGTLFDPEYAMIMQHLIDLDQEYHMKELTDKARSDKDSLECKGFRENISDGIFITENPTTIRLTCISSDVSGMPSFVLFDSLDEKVHTEEPFITDLNYFEYATMRFDGETVVTGARKSKTVEGGKNDRMGTVESENTDENTETPDEVMVDMAGSFVSDYVIVAGRHGDHAMFNISNEKGSVSVIVALPDSVRFLYAGITGENCHISNIKVEKSENKIGDNYIPRIAEKISFINGPEGDVPNVEINGYRTDTTESIPVKDGMELHFHTMSLPTARLVWHTAFIDIFSSDNKKVDGPNHREYALIRLDGEYWDDSGGFAENSMDISKNEEFTGWDDWKEINKKGFDVKIRFERNGNQITTITENFGISIHNVTTIKGEKRELYVTISGDQVALTNIRVVD